MGQAGQQANSVGLVFLQDELTQYWFLQEGHFCYFAQRYCDLPYFVIGRTTANYSGQRNKFQFNL